MSLLQSVVWLKLEFMFETHIVIAHSIALE